MKDKIRKKIIENRLIEIILKKDIWSRIEILKFGLYCTYGVSNKELFKEWLVSEEVPFFGGDQPITLLEHEKGRYKVKNALIAQTFGELDST